MIFKETRLNGAFIIDLEMFQDRRGFFARTWCQKEFETRGLNPRLVQCNVSYNPKMGTLRGMHYQVPPRQEAKLVRCIRGSIYDVIVDLRMDSPTYKQYLGITLTSKTRTMLYIPEGFAHGFLTLRDDTEILYKMSEFYSPNHARGFRWDDPAFNIKWPEEVKIISRRDRNFPDFNKGM